MIPPEYLNQIITGDARVLIWFSCGAASACAAKLALEQRPDAEILYCDTLAYEHPDNRRFLSDCAKWYGKEIKLLRSEEYTDIFDVFNRTGWLVGPAGARCTTELKKKVRENYANPRDVHVFGYTADEHRRIARFEKNNPELYCWWVLQDAGMDKQSCLATLNTAEIELPAMYRLGYRNNNCIGCVKGGKGYWNKIRRDFPDAFERMAQQEHKMDVRIFKDGWLDDLPPDAGRYDQEFDIECGVVCTQPPLFGGD